MWKIRKAGGGIMVGMCEDKELFSKFANVVMDAREDNEARDNWHKQRLTSLGGSEIACVLGQSTYGSAYTVFQDKMGIAEPFSGNKFTRFGISLEPIIRDWVQNDFEESTGIELKTEEYPFMMISKEIPFLSANIDGLAKMNKDYEYYRNDDTGEIKTILANELIGIEIKTAGEFMKDQWADEVLPSAYYCQCLQYLFVTGLKHFLIVYLIGRDVKWKVISRDEEDIKVLKETAIQFWNNNILLKIPPAPTGIEADTKAILYNQDLEGDTEQEISDNKLTKYQEISDQLKVLGKEKERIKQLIYLDLENNKKGTDGNYKVSRFEVKKDKVDLKLLKEKHSEIYKEVYKGQTEFVSMRITKCK